MNSDIEIENTRSKITILFQLQQHLMLRISDIFIHRVFGFKTNKNHYFPCTSCCYGDTSSLKTFNLLSPSC